MSLHPTTATIHQGSPRAEQWRRVFGSDTVPIKSPIPVHAHLPGLGLRKVYLVEVGALSAEQIEAVIAHLAERFCVEAREVRADLLAEHGLPILAEDLAVACDARLFL
jgi:hypothetical protein